MLDQVAQRFCGNRQIQPVYRPASHQDQEVILGEGPQRLSRVLGIKVETARLGPDIGRIGTSLYDQNRALRPIREGREARRLIIGKRRPGSGENVKRRFSDGTDAVHFEHGSDRYPKPRRN